MSDKPNFKQTFTMTFTHDEGTQTVTYTAEKGVCASDDFWDFLTNGFKTLGLNFVAKELRDE